MNKRTMGALLAQSGMTPIERAHGRIMRAPDHGAGAGGEGQGGAAGAGGEGSGGAAGAGGEGSGGAAEFLKAGEAQGAQGGEGQGSGAGDGTDWFETFSAEAPAEGKKSNRDYLASKNFKDPDALVASYRDLESRLFAGDKLVIPKDGDPPEVVEQYAKAMGRPEAPEGYKVEMPEGVEVDEELLGKMQQLAFDDVIRPETFAKMVQAFNEHGQQLLAGQSDAQLAEKQQGVQELRGEWGDDFQANVAAANRAMAAMELDMDFITRMEAGLGTKDTMKLLQRIGAGMGEDSLIGEGGQKFQIPLEAAKAELQSMRDDAKKSEKLMKGDADLTKRRKMLLNIVAAHEAAEQKRQQMG